MTEPDGAAPSNITDHGFKPRTKPKFKFVRGIGWVKLGANPHLCQKCGIAEAAHAR